MASRQYLISLIRHTSSLIFFNPRSFRPLKTLIPQLASLQRFPQILHPNFDPHLFPSRRFSSRSENPRNPKFVDQEQEDHDEEEDETSDEEEDEEMSENESIESAKSNLSSVSRAYSVEDKIKEAEDIGYKVIGPLQPDDRVFKPYEPVFAVVQIGSHQFKVSNGDAIYVEKLKFCEVNDKLCLSKVLMVGSPTQTIIGRPILPNAAVYAVVEEHALDAKVIIFKKKRRKNYRRTKGHRQELTRLRITGIQGVEKPKTPSAEKTSKTSSSKKVEKVADAA